MECEVWGESSYFIYFPHRININMRPQEGTRKNEYYASYSAMENERPSRVAHAANSTGRKSQFASVSS